VAASAGAERDIDYTAAISDILTFSVAAPLCSIRQNGLPSVAGRWVGVSKKQTMNVWFGGSGRTRAVSAPAKYTAGALLLFELFGERTNVLLFSYSYLFIISPLSPPLTNISCCYLYIIDSLYSTWQHDGTGSILLFTFLFLLAIVPSSPGICDVCIPTSYANACLNAAANMGCRICSVTR